MRRWKGSRRASLGSDQGLDHKSNASIARIALSLLVKSEPCSERFIHLLIMNVNSRVDVAFEALLENNGWKAIEGRSGPFRFSREHEIGDYLWTEELEFDALERSTFIQ